MPDHARHRPVGCPVGSGEPDPTTRLGGTGGRFTRPGVEQGRVPLVRLVPLRPPPDRIGEGIVAPVGRHATQFIIEEKSA